MPKKQISLLISILIIGSIVLARDWRDAVQHAPTMFRNQLNMIAPERRVIQRQALRKVP